MLSCLVCAGLSGLAPAALRVYIVEPVLCLALGLWVTRAGGRAGRATRAAEAKLAATAAVAATLQIALTIVGGAVDGFHRSPQIGVAGRLLAGWCMWARLVALELVRWRVVIWAKAHGSGLAMAAGTLLFIAGPDWPRLVARAGAGASVLPLVGQQLLPAATENLLASYLALVGGPFSALAYRGTLAAFAWLSPVVPNLRWPTAALLAVGNPFLGWLIVSERVEQERLKRQLQEGIAAGTAELLRTNALLERQIDERMRAEEELRRRNRELTVLNAVASTLSSSLELPRLVDSLAGLLATELGISGGALYRYEREEREFALRAAWGLPAEVEERMRRLPSAAFEACWREGALAPIRLLAVDMLGASAASVGTPGPPGEAPAAGGEAGAATPGRLGQRRRVGGRKQPLVGDPAALAGACSPCLGLPLQANGELRGAVCLCGPGVSGLSEDDAAFFSALAGQIAVAVHNADLYAEVRAGRERLQALSRRLVEALEAERRHIARELHDEAAQALTSLRLGLGLLERHLGDVRASRARLLQLKTLADAISEDLHRLAADLRPAILDHAGLVPALRQHTATLAAEHGIEVRFEAAGIDGERLPPEVESAVFRIVQEALANTIRHARARRVEVLVERRDGHLVAIVEDDGVGFDLREVADGGRLGLVGMRERAEMLGGKLTVETAPGAGTTVMLEVPHAGAHPDRR